VRWWWNGNKVTGKEIVREIALLQAAGIGGFEINPIQFPNPDDPLNIPALEWLSKPWIEMVQVAVRALQLAADDPRPLTVTGGLGFAVNVSRTEMEWTRKNAEDVLEPALEGPPAHLLEQAG